jgi:hypothetical protein
MSCDKNQPCLSLRQLWEPLCISVDCGIFVLVHGYIDESYNADVFTLSCLLGSLKTWTAMSSAWKRCLQRWNVKLKAEGRKPLSRYHAKDCGNLRAEFAGWSVDEQRTLTSDLIAIFKRHPVVVMAFSIDLKELYSVFPEAKQKAKPDAIGSVYRLMTKFLLYQIGREMGGRNRFVLIFDRGPYASSMLQGFNLVLADKGFEHAQCFPSFTSMGWEQCIPLQAADLIAYESFKEACRQINPRKRRKTLELLLDLNSFGGRTRWINRDALLAMRDAMQNKTGV